ncbi:hypothetical protein H0H92_010688 [Tricholoma furcatifolium]|nr:hypothetical protein H0H92_010688 [Tricholoma furcatifolium]
MTELLCFIFRPLRQPRVISEVIAGIFLGPSVMGRIPGFSNAIFPTTSLPGLTLTSTIGLVIYLFLVGLEIDTKIVRRHPVAASSISFTGLAIPLGLGAALGAALYKDFISPTVKYGYFLLFTAVAVGITAFPVLCRILTELRLLETTVGSVTLAAGVGNDIVGWILLALTVALVNAASGLTALYVLLASAGYAIFLLFPGRWAYTWLVRRTGSLERGTPTNGIMVLTLIIVLVSAFFTDIIGVHPIFGGFISGLIIPHENGYAIALVEKLEDFVCIILIPIYFTLTGLKTNLGSMNSGKTWGYTFLICTVAFFAKFIPCFSSAMATGFNWRESGAVGSLMSCKGLVELIVLNIGFEANILDTRSFSMFVVHSVILTFITTPLTLAFYPPKYRTRDAPKPDHSAEGGAASPRLPPSHEVKSRFTVVLDRIEQLPAAMMITHLLHPGASSVSKPLSSDDKSENSTEKAAAVSRGPRIYVNALRLLELTNRTSAVLKSQVAESLAQTDPVVSVFRTFGYLNNLLVSAALSIVNHNEFSSTVSEHVAETESQMVIVPWCRGSTQVGAESDASAHNPFDGVFHKNSGNAVKDQTGAVVYSEFIRNVFASCKADVALFVERGIPPTGPDTQHLLLPFIGGPDDRLALAFLVQLARNPSVQATVVRIEKTDDLSRESTLEKKDVVPSTGASIPIVLQTLTAGDTVYAAHDTQTHLASQTADNVAWDRFTSASATHDLETAAALSRISFTTLSTPTPLQAITDLASKVSQENPSQNVIVMIGRSRRLATENHKAELQKVVAAAGASISSSVPKTLGDVGAALVASNTRASLLVLQATLGA